VADDATPDFPQRKYQQRIIPTAPWQVARATSTGVEKRPEA
jgi:hypothetical protein